MCLLPHVTFPNPDEVWSYHRTLGPRFGWLPSAAQTVADQVSSSAGRRHAGVTEVIAAAALAGTVQAHAAGAEGHLAGAAALAAERVAKGRCRG